MAGKPVRPKTSLGLYTEPMARAWRAVEKPAPITVDIVDKGDHLALRVYEDEIMNCSEPVRVRIMTYLADVERVIESFGVQCVAEGAKGGPTR